MEYENTFVREVKEKNITEPSEILNWYRNLYHTEDNHTEHGIVAYAINDFFADVVPKSEVERLQAEKDALIKNYAECMKDYASEIFAEIEFDIHQLMFERDETRAIAIEGIIANAKKKYIGE